MMYKALINILYLLLIKSTESHYGYSLLEIDTAANKIVLFNIQSSIRKS